MAAPSVPPPGTATPRPVPVLVALVGVGQLVTGGQVRGLPPAVLILAGVVLAVAHVVALVRLRDGARPGWVLGLALHLLVGAALEWDVATSADSRMPPVWQIVGVAALLLPATRAHAGVGRPRR